MKAIITKYTKPKCDCGNSLLFQEQCATFLMTPITNKGKLSKRGRYDTGLDSGCLPDDRLHCTKCCIEYDFFYDENRRIVRGKLWEN